MSPPSLARRIFAAALDVTAEHVAETAETPRFDGLALLVGLAALGVGAYAVAETKKEPTVWLKGALGPSTVRSVFESAFGEIDRLKKRGTGEPRSSTPPWAQHRLVDDVADVVAAAAAAEESMLAARSCPKCNADLRRTRDPRQAGTKPAGSAWYCYRCVCCTFAVDRAETMQPDEAAASAPPALGQCRASLVGDIVRLDAQTPDGNFCPVAIAGSAGCTGPHSPASIERLFPIVLKDKVIATAGAA